LFVILVYAVLKQIICQIVFQKNKKKEISKKSRKELKEKRKVKQKKV